MATIVDVTAGATAAAALLALVLAILAVKAWRVTRAGRHGLLALAFLAGAGQAAVLGMLLLTGVPGDAPLPPLWIAVPLLHGGTILLMYLATLGR